MNGEEQKRQGFKAEMSAQLEQDRIITKGKEYARVEKAIQKLEAEKEERMRTVDDYEARISLFMSSIVIGMITKDVRGGGNSIELNAAAAQNFSEKETLDGVDLFLEIRSD